MPCYDPEHNTSAYAEKIDKLTRMLCEAMRIVEGHEHRLKCSTELRDWWDNHKKQDAARERG